MGYIAGRSEGVQDALHPVEASSEVHLGHFVAAVVRRRWTVLAIFVGFVTLSVLIVNALTPRYTAELSLTLDMKGGADGVTGNLSGGIVSKDMEEIGSAINAILTDGTVRQVVAKLNLQDDPEFDPLIHSDREGFLGRIGLLDYIPARVRSAIWGRRQSMPATSREFMISNTVAPVTKRLSVLNDGKSYTITISFTAYEPEKAALIANTFGEWYVQHRKDRRSKQLDQISGLLMEKSDTLRNRVVESEAAVEAYRQQHGIVNLANENTLNVDALTKLNTELINAHAAAAEAEANLREMQRFANDESRETAAFVVGNAPNLITLRDQLNQIKAQIASLSRSYLDTHPTIVSLKSRLAEVSQQLNDETDRVLAGLRARVQVARSNEAQIQSSMSQLTAAGQQTARAGSELTQLESRRDADRAVYQTYLENAGRAGVEASAQAFDAEITSPAVPPLWPSYPQRGLFLGLSVFCGLFIAIAAAIILDLTRRGVATIDELAGIKNVRVLGMVPRSGKRARAVDWSLSSLTIKEPLGTHAEAIRSIGVALLPRPGVPERKLALITSALPGEGKTSLVLSLGRLAAASGKSVLVMECDLRRPALRRSLPPGQFGLVDVLMGKVGLETATQVDEASGLRYIAAGSRALYPAELLQSDAMKTVLESVRTQYDLVIIDTPPIGVVSDALVLSAYADATIVVMRSGKTDKRAYAMALDRILQFGSSVTGVVLSHVARQEFLKYCSKGEVSGYFNRSRA